MVGFHLNHPSRVFGAFERQRRESSPALNVGRTPGSIDVHAFAPGLDASKIEVTLDRGVLRIVGERRADTPEGGEAISVRSRERSNGAFERAVALPDDVDASSVSASYRDGVLHVSIARREAAQPQRITVQ